MEDGRRTTAGTHRILHIPSPISHLLSPCHKHCTHWLANFDDLPGGNQLSRLQINPENDDVSRVLVLHQHPVTRRINREMPRRLALRELVFNQSKPAARWLDAV